MLTVKVIRDAVTPDGNFEGKGRFTTRIVEAKWVDIHVVRPGELYEVVAHEDEGPGYAFLIVPRDKPKPEGFAGEVDFWTNAYIENASGATTEIVRL